MPSAAPRGRSQGMTCETRMQVTSQPTPSTATQAKPSPSQPLVMCSSETPSFPCDPSLCGCDCCANHGVLSLIVSSLLILAVMFLTCPPAAPVKARMMAATVKTSLIKYLEQSGINVTKQVCVNPSPFHSFCCQRSHTTILCDSILPSLVLTL